MINTEIINECTKKQLPFSEVIKHLTHIGIERYYTDLIKMEKTYYSQGDEFYVEPMLIEHQLKVSEKFEKTKLIESLRSIQKDVINYHTFVKNIIAAGTVSYTVYIRGKQAHYVGRDGEVYIEKFSF